MFGRKLPGVGQEILQGDAQHFQIADGGGARGDHKLDHTGRLAAAQFVGQAAHQFAQVHRLAFYLDVGDTR